MKNKKLFSLWALALFALTLSGCTIPGQESHETMPDMATAPAADITSPVTPVNSGDAAAPVKEFTMESYTNVVNGEYRPRFSIGQINVKKWDKVIIHIKTTSGTHDFNLDEFGIKAVTPTDQTVTVEFVADKVGSFEYYCSMPGHRQNGHWGTLIVDEQSDPKK